MLLNPSATRGQHLKEGRMLSQAEWMVFWLPLLASCVNYRLPLQARRSCRTPHGFDSVLVGQKTPPFKVLPNDLISGTFPETSLWHHQGTIQWYRKLSCSSVLICCHVLGIWGTKLCHVTGLSGTWSELRLFSLKHIQPCSGSHFWEEFDSLTSSNDKVTCLCDILWFSEVCKYSGLYQPPIHLKCGE